MTCLKLPCLKSKIVVAAMLAGALMAAGAGQARAQSAPPFGDPESIAYSQKLWQALKNAKLVGEDAIVTRPYEGTDPHGIMLETLKTTATVDGRTAMVIVKRNYGPAGVSMEEVLADRMKHLGAVTVMFKRENGYDDENQNWFWAKYLKDGSLDKNPKGMELAGRVAKGADQGCIACHTAAPGNDMSYLYDLDR